ncbi:MAG: helix-turn-helix domain-containing protein, partial [Proteobacteria bacterium]|nr:helix-turn-helix domain-containing protein [Pseudomonadota bacterium]
MEFGAYIRAERLRLQQTDRAFSLRQVADRVGIKPTYLSKIERGELPPP